jgi:RNA polymerase sigma-70 factor (ECF subfamily)
MKRHFQTLGWLQKLAVEPQREALILVGAGGLSYEEAAEVTGAAVGTMKSRVTRGRDAIALIYAEGHHCRRRAPGLRHGAIPQQVATLTARMPI